MDIKDVTATAAECELAISTVLLVNALGTPKSWGNTKDVTSAAWYTVLSRLGTELLQSRAVPLSMLHRESSSSRTQAIARFRNAVEHHVLDGSVQDRTRALGLLSLQILRDIPVASHRLH